jgi:hypothetical protein
MRNNSSDLSGDISLLWKGLSLVLTSSLGLRAYCAVQDKIDTRPMREMNALSKNRKPLNFIFPS